VFVCLLRFSVTFDGRPLGLEAAQKLVKVFDKDRNGRIDFVEYASMHKFITKVRQAFLMADTDRSGRIEAREIHQALAYAGLNFISFNSILELLHKYDRTRMGLSWEEFLMLAAQCAHCKSIFEWYISSHFHSSSFNNNGFLHHICHIFHPLFYLSFFFFFVFIID
jgi:Ca2+-binding EF-hand superfamily protein